MEWWLAFVIVFGGLAVILVTGIPVAFGFMLVNIVGVLIWWGGTSGLPLLILSIRESVGTWSFLTIPLFLLMGDVMFRSGTAALMLDALDKWVGHVPGRLALLTVAGGTIFSTLSGSGIASIAMLGSQLLPDMQKRGYQKAMSLGPIIGSGGLAIMIPPSSVAIILASLAGISVGKLLVAIIVPGLLMATNYTLYIIVRCKLQPYLAPAYNVTDVPLSEKVVATARYILPLGSVVFAVIGLMMLGIASPTEAAASGCLMTFIVAAAYRRLNWETVKKGVIDATSATIMIFMILAGAAAFSQIVGFSGASQGLMKFVLDLPLAPILILFGMQFILWFLGMFVSIVPIMMITIPVFMPVVYALGFDPIWWAVIYMINMEMAGSTPPFGIYLFTLQAVAPRGTTFGECVRAGLPWLGCDLVSMVLVIAFPAIALWLPSLMIT